MSPKWLVRFPCGLPRGNVRVAGNSRLIWGNGVAWAQFKRLGPSRGQIIFGACQKPGAWGCIVSQTIYFIRVSRHLQHQVAWAASQSAALAPHCPFLGKSVPKPWAQSPILFADSYIRSPGYPCFSQIPFDSLQTTALPRQPFEKPQRIQSTPRHQGKHAHRSGQGLRSKNVIGG